MGGCWHGFPYKLRIGGSFVPAYSRYWIIGLTLWIIPGFPIRRASVSQKQRTGSIATIDSSTDASFSALDWWSIDLYSQINQERSDLMLVENFK